MRHAIIHLCLINPFGCQFSPSRAIFSEYYRFQYTENRPAHPMHPDNPSGCPAPHGSNAPSFIHTRIKPAPVIQASRQKVVVLFPVLFVNLTALIELCTSAIALHHGKHRQDCSSRGHNIRQRRALLFRDEVLFSRKYCSAFTVCFPSVIPRPSQKACRRRRTASLAAPRERSRVLKDVLPGLS